MSVVQFGASSRTLRERVVVASLVVLVLATFAMVALSLLVPDAFGSNQVPDFDSKILTGLLSGGGALGLLFIARG